MKVPIDDIIRHHGEKLWYLANRMKIGMWDNEDLFQEIALRLSQHEFNECETPCRCGCGEILPWHGGHINRQANSITIDIRRTEVRRRRGRVRSSTADLVIAGVPDGDPPIWAVLSNRDLAARILEVMTDMERRILQLVANPDAETIAIAEAEREEARRDAAENEGVLRMNIHTLKIHNKHVAQRLGISNVAVSRALRSARQLVADVQIHAGHVA